MEANLITTTYRDKKAEKTESIIAFTEDSGVEMEVVNLYPEIKYQSFEGFGGAITEAAGFTFASMSRESQKKILEAYFGEKGNCYNFIRTHIDSCDFSLDQYEAMSNAEDSELKTFSLERDEKYILPFLKGALREAGHPINLMLSPWSPPSFMKTNGKRIEGGALKKEYRELWAEYITKYLLEYKNRGLKVKMITIQNEPKAKQRWDSCIYTVEEEKEFLRDFLYPSLLKNNLQDVEVFIWDHNKERVFERAREIIDKDTDSMVSGVAFHWYSGDHFEALRIVREFFPEKKLFHTEGCVEYSRFSEKDQLQNAQMYANDIIGNINAGMNAYIDWNIILDRQGGPNHAGNFCDAPIMCDLENDTVIEKLTFNYIGHFSRYITPGARRIAFTKYTERLDITALENEDGSIVVVLLNRFDGNRKVVFRMKGKTAEFNVPPSSITTAVIN